jgi:DtxR family Mn-dependent transcriptional regulator
MAGEITPAMQDYLGLVYRMQREGQVVIGARLADRLGVSRPTVTVMLQRMIRAGLVRMNEGKEVSLTPNGIEAARDLLRRHKLTEWLLREVVGLPWHKVHEEAHRLEHHLSEETVDRLEILFEQRDVCPHGNPMPGAELPNSVPLHEVPEGESVSIVRVLEEAEQQGDLMAFFEESGLLPGACICVLAHRPFNETMTVEVDAGPRADKAPSVTLGLAVARFIQVQPAEGGSG